MRAAFRYVFALVLLAVLPAGAAEPSLALKQNDVWVMAGDSITAQRLHTNFIEAFYRTRYPTLNNNWRAASKAHDQQKLTEAQIAIVGCESQIRKACTPVPLRFTLEKQK